MILLLLVLWVIVVAMSSCGGGGGSSTQQPSGTPTPPPPPRPIEFTFFGQSDPAVTAPFTSTYHAVDWGNWETQRQDIGLRIIAEMQAARARGVDRFILSTGFLTFDNKCNWLGTAALDQFKFQLQALDLARSVWMLYPMDEPDVHGCSGTVMAEAYAETRAAWGDNVRIGVIYGPNGPTPGIDQVTDAGRDRYTFGPQPLNLRADQRLMIVAGGADPYRDDPQQYVDYALQHGNVSVVWAFLFVNYTDPEGRPQKGIANNGLLNTYHIAGCKLTQKC